VTQILNVTNHWGSRGVCAYMHWPRLRKLMIFEHMPLGTKVAVVYKTDDEVYEEHFHTYPTSSGFPQFVLSHD
jgi:hypothetical protein